MLEVDEALIDSITETFYHLLNGKVPGAIPIPEDVPDNEIRQLITYLNRFLAEHAPFARAIQGMAEGKLDTPAPTGRMAVVLAYKALCSNLRHVTWKTQRIAAGNLDETVDFMGEFSTAFNRMTQQLKDSFAAIELRNQELNVANKIIQAEKEKSEKLLLNVLPARVAEELKERGRSDPQSFDQVTVYFSDVVGFTGLSSNVTPHDLIGELNEIFTHFDEIMEAHGCERIKTIGDAYLAVCGMPEPREDHAHAMLQAAVETLEYMRERNRDRAEPWPIRIGLHSGRLVGGIVGVRKYIYDVFGDTINTASRMETASEPMRINVSEATWRLVKDDVAFLEREAIPVKGKGSMRMYFVDV